MTEQKKATKQPKRASPISGTPPPDGFEKYPERRHNGAWKKEDTRMHRSFLSFWTKVLWDERSWRINKEGKYCY